MNFYVIKDENYNIGDPFATPSKKIGICIDPINNLWLVPKNEISNEDPRIVTDKLKLKKVDDPKSKYYKRYMVPVIPSGSPEIEMTDKELIYADLKEAQTPLTASLTETYERQGKLTP
jgi:hypothetical protein